MAKFKPYVQDQGELLPGYLGDLIPEDHLARLVSDIVQQLNLTAITKRYSNRGEEAYHPAMLLKILFYGYATGVSTSRPIGEALKFDLPFRWLSGGNKPDFRTISDFRKKNLTLLPDLFRQIIQIATHLGYVSLNHVSIDGSKIKAYASKSNSVSRRRMKKEMQLLETAISEKLQEDQKIDERDPLYSQELESDLTEPVDPHLRRQKIKEGLEQLERQRPEAESQKPEKDAYNFTDPDSRIMKTRNEAFIQGYNPQIAVDAEHRLIVGLQMSNQGNDQLQFAGVLASIAENNGRMPEKVSADAGYFSAANIQTAEIAKVDAYISATKEGKKVKNPYDKTNFTYNPDKGIYICPEGKALPLKKTKHANSQKLQTRWIYECQECSACPFQNECVKGKSGKRQIYRSESDPLRETMRTKVQSDEGKAIYSLRKTIVEPQWGEMKEHQRFRQFHLRGEEKVKGEFFLLSISHNIRKIHSATYPKKDTLYKREKSAQKRKRAS